MKMVGIEKHSVHSLWKSRLRQEFREIVDEMPAAAGADPVQFGLLRQLEMNLVAMEADPFGVDDSMRLKPPPGRSVQVVGDSAIGVSRFVTDDVNLQTSRTTEAEKGKDSGIRLGLAQPRAIDVSLEFRPIILATGASKVVPDVRLVRRRAGRNPPAFEADTMEELIVANDRVVEVDADDGGPGQGS